VEPDPYVTWPPYPDGHVEDLFRQANRDDFVIVHLDGIYMRISPDGARELQFQRLRGALVGSLAGRGQAAGALVRADEERLRGAVMAAFQDQHQGDRQRLLRR
jgi:hypothetical protein